jgi:hypothetical protein
MGEAHYLPWGPQYNNRDTVPALGSSKSGGGVVLVLRVCIACEESRKPVLVEADVWGGPDPTGEAGMWRLVCP